MNWRVLTESLRGRSLVAAAVLSAAAPGFAASINVSHDTWVREDSSGSNRNADGQMNARTDIDADDNDVILLRFPTTALPSGVSGVSLNLFWQRNDGSSTNTLKLYGLNETDPDETTWDETTVTYDTAPGLIPDGSDPTAETAAMASYDEVQDLDVANLTLLVADQPYGPQVLDAQYSFSGAALDAFLNADTNGEVTFLILRSNVSNSGNQARFWQKEAGQGATLTFVPEPSTALITLLGAVALLRRRG